MKSHDLFIAIIGLGECLDGAGLDHEQIAKCSPHETGCHRAATGRLRFDDGVETVDVFGTKAQEAEGGKTAVAACNLDFVE